MFSTTSVRAYNRDTKNFVRNRIGRLFRIYIWVLRFIGKLGRRIIRKKLKGYKTYFFVYLRARAVADWKFMEYWQAKERRAGYLTYRAFGRRNHQEEESSDTETE